jgi:DNA polymerase-3 subunit alpha
MPALRRKGVLTLDEAAAKAERGACLVKLAGVVTARQERKSARGNRFAFLGLSDITGAYEVTLFSEVLENSRAHLESGMRVVVTAEATMEAEQLKLLGRSVAPMDMAVADAGATGLRVFVEAETALPSVASVLDQAKAQAQRAPKGPIYLCLMADGVGEVEIDLNAEFPVTPQIKGAIKSLDGVLDVQEV